MKVRITFTEEALGSAPSNEELLATYIASKAPTSELSAEEIDNIKAQNAEDRWDELDDNGNVIGGNNKKGH